MMINVFALAAEGSTDAAINWGERAATAGVTTLLGMVTIFLVLALLWGCIEIMHFLLHRGEKKEKPVKAEKSAPTASTAPVVDDAAIAAAIAASLAASEDDGATVAAITAAITAMRAEQGCDGAFRVVSFKRVGKNISRRRF
ncbi:MAG: OadG family protein [Clostridia bacterium]|nr:OadG family protein [Clostridia bacterium]